MAMESRIMFFCSEEEKAKFERAAAKTIGADQRGLSLSAFIRAAAHKMADRVLNNETT